MSASQREYIAAACFKLSADLGSVWGVTIFAAGWQTCGPCESFNMLCTQMQGAGAFSVLTRFRLITNILLVSAEMFFMSNIQLWYEITTADRCLNNNCSATAEHSGKYGFSNIYEFIQTWSSAHRGFHYLGNPWSGCRICCSCLTRVTHL